MTSQYYSLKGIPHHQLSIYEKKLNHWLHINLANQSIDFQSLSSIENELRKKNTSINALNTLNIFNQNIFDILLKENIEPIYPDDKAWIDKSRMPNQASFFEIISDTDMITRIDSSGNRFTFLNEEDVGRWDFYVDPMIGEEGPFIYAFEYTGSQGLQYDSGYVDISEEGKRFILIGPGIGTDVHFTIDEFTGNELLLNQYAPIQDTVTYQLSIRIAKK